MSEFHPSDEQDNLTSRIPSFLSRSFTSGLPHEKSKEEHTEGKTLAAKSQNRIKNRVQLSKHVERIRTRGLREFVSSSGKRRLTELNYFCSIIIRETPVSKLTGENSGT